ncbi:S9 family peptidase [Flavobacterium procerum]|uniref:S9 family peptidase n=1 Tax=Flavobacterium procerum TaxID=1455569 RepID=A0ABV6BQQ2_9FLAO
MKIYFKPNLRIHRRKASFILVLYLQLVACPLLGQVKQKKWITSEDYSKWGTLRINNLSADGSWASYSVSYENARDTLFIKNIKSMQTFAFPQANTDTFAGSDWFFYHNAQGMNIFNLKTGRNTVIANALQYIYSPAAKKIIALTTSNGKEKTLLICALNGNIQKKISKLDLFIVSNDKKMLLYTTSKNGTQTISISDLTEAKQDKDLLKCRTSFSNLIWHPKGNALAFTQKAEDESMSGTALLYYSLSTDKMYKSSKEYLIRNVLGDSLSVAEKNKLKISDDSHNFFFLVEQKYSAKKSNSSDLQFWNTNAKWIYPIDEKRKKSRKTYLALWLPLENKYELISNDTLPSYMLTGDKRYAVLSNPQRYEPQFDYEGKRDFYIKNLSSGERRLLLKNHSAHYDHTIPSPGGKYIAYFKDENWWIYDIKNGKHSNITENLGSNFASSEKQYQNKDPYPVIGWTQNDKEILLYDAYDLWSLTPDGASAWRLTKGRETNTQFRLCGNLQKSIAKSDYGGITYLPINMKQGLPLETVDSNGNYGFYKWHPNTIKQILSSSNMRLDQLIESQRRNLIAYTEERYDLPPRLMIRNLSKKKSKCIFQSNPQQKFFYWGKSEMINYKNSKGEALKGILFYPAQYSVKKKYPMIVYIYEKLAKDLHHKYLNPSQYYGDGSFNISNFTTQGYFVLAPDISYELGNPGLSAVDCVEAATKKIISAGLVYPDKIGITGHSFGGYETNFIITQSNLFAAALSGSAASDLTSLYLNIGNSGRPDIWRFENQQWRMGRSLFEDKEAYDRNTPILYAKNITAPLLSWTGGDDKQVNWNQSIELYLALRRLKKKHILLLYPGEGHTLTKKENQKDLSEKFQEWFDYHLKDVSPADWIKTGLQ